MRVQIALIALAMALTGCASVQMGDAQQDSALKNFKAPTNMAGLYVYRNETMGAAVKMDVFVDGARLGETASKTYFYKELTPGKHTVSSKAENTDTLEVDARPGTLLFVWQEVKMGLMYARTKLTQVSEEVGRKGVLESKLAATQ